MSYQSIILLEDVDTNANFFKYTFGDGWCYQPNNGIAFEKRTRHIYNATFGLIPNRLTKNYDYASFCWNQKLILLEKVENADVKRFQMSR